MKKKIFNAAQFAARTLKENDVTYFPDLLCLVAVKHLGGIYYVFADKKTSCFIGVCEYGNDYAVFDVNEFEESIKESNPEAYAELEANTDKFYNEN